MSSWIKIIGTQTGKFILGLTGSALKNNAGTIEVRNNADDAFEDLSAQAVVLNGNSSGKNVTIETSGSQSVDYALTLPVDAGSPGQVLATDGSGVLSWASAASTASNWKADTTSFAFGSGSVITAFTLPANAVVDTVTVIVDTPWDTAANISVGFNGGSASYYVASTDTLLTLGDRFDIPQQHIASGTTQDIEIYYSAASATAGAGRVIVTYAIPA